MNLFASLSLKGFLLILEVFIDPAILAHNIKLIVPWITFVYVWLRFESIFSHHRAKRSEYLRAVKSEDKKRG